MRTITPRTRWSALLVAGGLGLAGCGDGEPSGEPSCTMTWRAYAVTAVDLPRNADEGQALGLDLDLAPGDVAGGIDNQLGAMMGAFAQFYAEAWDPERAVDATVTAGATRWVLDVGTCADGDEVRVAAARAVDADGDGRWTITDRGVPSIGARVGDGVLTTRHGLGWAPVGALVAGAPEVATDAWQAGTGLATALVIGADRIDGRLGLGLALDTPAMLAPICAFLDQHVAIGPELLAEDMDSNGDGTIDGVECRASLLMLVTSDLDLGTCDDPACFQPRDADGVRDHVSLGLGVHAEAIELASP